ncbi:hypothetical protein CANARDRAFT_27927 [[Candida] arabinofermentans NRRL YB-2248]|uniref:Succinate dehydrogenase [ubiquinone] cytochrome b small subunit n=1 Tax=[Candida] arabinofermentans NRRL YB-2248 TaxID=983967 RepID=A0A1E4T267_9ASCO|nr:hypothetical protein CANARDRAFT_27927 [[Candida] arabinofermentans NRRL YB-2248]
MLSSTTRLGLGLASSFTRPTFKSAATVAPSLLSRSLFIKTIPQPPGNIIDTVNEAYVAPPPHKLHGSVHWTSERLVTVLMAPLMITPMIAGTTYPLADGIMGTLLMYHCYAGFQSCITDYIPLRVYGVWHKAAMGLLAFGTLVGVYGVYIIETTEKEGLVGIAKRLWAL